MKPGQTTDCGDYQLDSLRSNVDAILRRAHQLQPRARLVLVGMKIPPNYGRAYSQQFESIYPQLARAHSATLVPFLLEGVGGVSALTQADGVHPTAEGAAEDGGDDVAGAGAGSEGACEA